MVAVLLTAFIAFAQARKLSVGPGKTYAMPMNAAAAVRDGDTVEIEPGVYDGETASWNADNLVLRGASAYARLNAPAAIPNGKAIWVIGGRNTTVENIEFANASVPDRNGAGIRQEGDGLTVRHCYFHDNENGILGGGGANSQVVIEYSEFSRNGQGDGYSHNLYIANVAGLTFRFCNTHHARIGHNLKSRANVNHILYNRILDSADGTASYEVDLPDGGEAYLIGNVIQQGPQTGNSAMVSYGEESDKNAGRALHIVNNTFVNDHSKGAFVSARSGTAARLANNIFAGPGTILSGAAGDTVSNWIGSDPGFVSRIGYDYHLTGGSAAVDQGSDPGAADGFSLAPVFQYQSNASGIARNAVGTWDIGAFEYGIGNGIFGVSRARRTRGMPAVRYFDLRGRRLWADGSAADRVGPVVLP